MRNSDYHYVIYPEFSDELFDDTVNKIKSNMPDWTVMELLFDWLDGDRVQRFEKDGKYIVVVNDFMVDALYIDADVELSCISDYFGRNPHYTMECRMYDTKRPQQAMCEIL